MKIINFIIFFSIVLTIYGLVNFYIFIRGWQAISHYPRWRIVYLFIFMLLASAFFIGRILEKIWLCPLTEALVWIGSFWWSAMLYFFLIIILVDLFRLVNHLVPLFPFIMRNIEQAKLIVFVTVIGIVALILAFGHLNAIYPRVKTIEISIPKKADMESIHIVAASDIHLGTIIGKERFCKIVNKINAMNPDLVLLPGDVIDEDLAPVIKENLGEALKAIQSKFGVIAITGNHEYIGGVEPAVKYLSEHGVTVLRDSVILINNSFYIVGREDRSINQFANKRRKPLTELVQKIDKKYPIILMDHQPFGLHEAVENDIDFQLSGHTHHGQLWPLNFITRAVYEVSWGYLKKGNTHFYVSSGAGTWGPPVRTGNRPEIVNIMIKFTMDKLPKN